MNLCQLVIIALSSLYSISNHFFRHQLFRRFGSIGDHGGAPLSQQVFPGIEGEDGFFGRHLGTLVICWVVPGARVLRESVHESRQSVYRTGYQVRMIGDRTMIVNRLCQ